MKKIVFFLLFAPSILKSEQSFPYEWINKNPQWVTVYSAEDLPKTDAPFLAIYRYRVYFVQYNFADSCYYFMAEPKKDTLAYKSVPCMLEHITHYMLLQN